MAQVGKCILVYNTPCNHDREIRMKYKENIGGDVRLLGGHSLKYSMYGRQR